MPAGDAVRHFAEVDNCSSVKTVLADAVDALARLEPRDHPVSVSRIGGLVSACHRDPVLHWERAGAAPAAGNFTQR